MKLCVLLSVVMLLSLCALAKSNPTRRGGRSCLESYPPLNSCPADNAPGFLSCDKPCNSSSDCPRAEPNCCNVQCGKTCLGNYQEQDSEKCPDPGSFNKQCIIFLHRCTYDSECSDGRKCCLVYGCGRECV
ncbi:hypothetical protein Pmani_008030 [Petrolisthes manimaculis]|uniref:WAP domain-containing protein n=1 Tax=Petrolisthes manimaculis TaxID=1843537 RepID=A0AAE1UJF5_9EUCA|nr:hypothetical protein Pmani_008030 [Petrolisthes manimaculis]